MNSVKYNHTRTTHAIKRLDPGTFRYGTDKQVSPPSGITLCGTQFSMGSDWERTVDSTPITCGSCLRIMNLSARIDAPESNKPKGGKQ